MYKFKLIKKINPQDKSAPKKWYAVPISESPQSFRDRAATGGAHNPDRQSGHITYHLQERGRREHRRLQYLVYDQGSPGNLHAQQRVPRGGD